MIASSYGGYNQAVKFPHLILPVVNRVPGTEYMRSVFPIAEVVGYKKWRFSAVGNGTTIV